MADLKDMPVMATMHQNKRKRGSQDISSGRNAPAMNQGNHGFDDGEYLQAAEDGMENTDHMMTFAAALAQQQQHLPQDPTDTGEQHHDAVRQMQEHAQQAHLQAGNGNGGGQDASDTAAAAMAQYHTMTVPQSTEQSFMAQEIEGDKQGEPGSNNAGVRTSSMGGEFDVAPRSPGADSSPTGQGGYPDSPRKPTVGSDEWHKVRRDNHKEVERRRRETINEGINELAKIVPGCEKNKGSILARAVQFITQLKENETQNIEKWTLEKLLTEQAIAELSSSCDKLKGDCQRAWAEAERWKAEAGGGDGEDKDGAEGDSG